MALWKLREASWTEVFRRNFLTQVLQAYKLRAQVLKASSNAAKPRTATYKVPQRSP